jgi:hypothetical protein
MRDELIAGHLRRMEEQLARTRGGLIRDHRP